MYTTCISINTRFLLFIGKLQGGPNSYPLLVHLVYGEAHGRECRGEFGEEHRGEHGGEHREECGGECRGEYREGHGGKQEKECGGEHRVWLSLVAIDLVGDNREFKVLGIF